MSSERGKKKWILNCLKKNLENKIILRNKQIYTGDEGKKLSEMVANLLENN